MTSKALEAATMKWLASPYYNCANVDFEREVLGYYDTWVGPDDRFCIYKMPRHKDALPVWVSETPGKSGSIAAREKEKMLNAQTLVENIIRAFADNLSEEAVVAFKLKIAELTGKEPVKKQFMEAIQTAIAKDLE